MGDPRLARIHGLIRDLVDSETHGIQLPMERLFSGVKWGNVELQKIERVFSVLFEDDKDPSFGGDEFLRVELARIAATEHREICACCQSGGIQAGRGADE